MADTARSPVTTTVLGAPGEHCSSCGAPLAADQRYCLNCGVRRADSRVPFPESLAGGGGPAAGATAAANGSAVAAGVMPATALAPAGAKPKRSWADRDLLLPVLGTALLAIAVGILIGRSGASDTINTKPPVVNIAPTAGAAAPTGTTANASADAAAADTAAKSASSKAKKTAEKAAPPANVSKSVLQDNANASGKDYVNKSKKLPTQVSTGGKALPKDDKPAGGGADAETIG